MLLSLYRNSIPLTTPLLKYYLQKRVRRGKEDVTRLKERYGIASMPRPLGKLLWCHGASVGESLSIQPLIKQFLATHSDWQVLVTTGTVTSAKLMAERLPERAFHQFIPLDNPPWVSRFLQHWRPDACLWLESELWPNILQQTAALKIPLLLVNGRLSAKSFATWQKYSRTAAKILKNFTEILTQSETYKTRFSSLTRIPVSYTGNLKYDAPPLPYESETLLELQKNIGQRPVWLASSTHPHEEQYCITAHQALVKKFPDLLTIIVPRHPHRGEEIAALIPPPCIVALRSKQDALTKDTAFYIADTMGELGLFYRLAEIVFIGGSLIPHGGQNMLEPALLHSAIIFGQHTFNFAPIVDELLEADAAIELHNSADLAATLQRLLENSQEREHLIKVAYQIATAQQGATTRVLKLLDGYLGKS
jgi:3-deoxy-D-manno-octulosonic-acid transferase